MSAVRATWKNGQVILEGPAIWPEGSRLVVSEAAGDMQDDREESPEAIAHWIAEFDAIEPLEMTAAEEADWQAARKAQRDHETATANERVKRLEDAWE